MTELLAVLTAIFVVYALYEVFATVSQSGDGLNRSAPDRRPVTPPPQPEPVKVQPEPVLTQAKAPPAAAVPPKPAAKLAEAEKNVSLRNPVTGEISPSPSNYRFAKKWIKEALVVEGLLPKIYKNSELTETLNLKAKDAIEQFKHLEKYHA